MAGVAAQFVDAQFAGARIGSVLSAFASCFEEASHDWILYSSNSRREPDTTPSSVALSPQNETAPIQGEPPSNIVLQRLSGGRCRGRFDLRLRLCDIRLRRNARCSSLLLDVSKYLAEDAIHRWLPYLVLRRLR